MRRLHVRHLPIRRAASGIARRQAPVQLSEEVQQRTELIHETTLAPLNARLLGPLERRPFTEGVPLPFVLLLGNHSSGKSSFINYVLGREVQATGVAPTDDGFTVIAPGREDTDRDGASFIGDPSLGIGALRVFGPSFVSHFNLKVRSGLQTDSLMLVDSPGMIDSPGSQRPAAAGEAFAVRTDAASRMAERGYDFLGVTRWLAERADVILLFFDPDKPGTTGETLECLTTSLATSEHKLYIVMNKVDQFVHLHDFARAYGSLCWNLSKVIPRKDLPRIYTMFLPASTRRDRALAAPATSSLSQALLELETTRDEVLEAVRRAPERRIDNLITRIHDEAAALRMHAVVADLARSLYTTKRNAYAALGGVVFAAGPLCGLYGWLEVGTSMEQSASVGAAGVFAAALVAFQTRRALRDMVETCLSDDGMDNLFERCYVTEVSEGDESVVSMWRSVRPSLQRALRTLSLGALPRLSKAELAALDEVLQQQVPDLRRLASPQQPRRPAAADWPPSPPTATPEPRAPAQQAE